MGIELSGDSIQVLITFGIYLVGVAVLGVMAHRYLAKGSFVKQYFLGNRGLGPWVLALTIAATAISGGTFMGFPSLIYTNGWVMALWIASYMLNPLMSMALMGKRLNQMGRIGGSVTVPDIFRDRFNSPALGLTAGLLILFFLIFNLVAQFKGGGIVMKEAMQLPPIRASFVGGEVTPGQHKLRVIYQLADGGTEAAEIAMPDPAAEYLPERTQVNEAEGKLTLFFKVGDREVKKPVSFPPQRVNLGLWNPEKGYLIGLIIFAITVVAYTTYGGFWAVTWTDVLEGVVMLIGVVLMAVLAVLAVEKFTADGVEYHGLAAATERLKAQNPELVYGPGPKNYLPLGLVFSFFIMWTMISAGQPSGMVRLMSFKDMPSLKRALLLVVFYYILTYISLIIIFICARAIFPTEFLGEEGSEGQPDVIMPRMTRYLTRDYPWVGGLLLAAPYAAIMSTVAAFLLLISSSLVRDLYQRIINPKVNEKTLKRMSYLITAGVGGLVAVLALNPPGFLQYIIVFTGSGQGCAFLFPMLLALYWKRATRQGVLAGMLGGFAVLLLFYVLGWVDSAGQAAVKQHQREVAAAVAEEKTPPEMPAVLALHQQLKGIPGWGEERLDGFAPLYFCGVDPLIWGLLASLGLSVGVSLATRPNVELVKKYFPD